MNIDMYQLIPLLALTAYMVYLTYYYAAPMFWLKVMLFYAHFRYRGCDIRFTGGTVTVRLQKDGAEQILERPLEVDPSSRFLASTTCSVFSRMLRDIRKGKVSEAEISFQGGDQFGLSAGEGTGRTGRQGTEEDRN